ncbi:MAG: hypothetical protein K1X56_03210 [Flavobacteriales bacterium]|nr:hypothetical protein [Flavobacteriales bacterium]
MISWIVFLVFTLVAIAVAISTRKKMFIETEESIRINHRKFNLYWIVRPAIIFTLGILAAMIQPWTLERIDAGYVGVKVNLTGSSRGADDITYQTGWVTYNTWFYTVHEFPTFQQHIEYDDQQVILKGGFATTIKPTFNYALKAEAVVDMFRELRLDIRQIEQGWLKTAIISSVNDVANKWEVDAIFNNREQFENAIIAECNKRVEKWFIVSQLRTNIVPPPALAQAIEDKTKAVQQAQAKMQEALVAEADGKKRIAIAKADSAQAVISASGRAESMLIEARAEAEATRLKQLQLTNLYIEYMRIQKWDGKYPSTVLGGGTPLINIK